MKTIIVCTSVSHGNTRKIADAIADVLEARVVDPDQVDATELAAYDLVGFGSGIFNMDFHTRLRDFVRALPQDVRRKSFVFATSGFPEPPFRRYTRSLSLLLTQRNYEVLDTFTCRAFDTYLPFKPFGGIRKGRPDANDLEAAREFAKNLRLQAAAAH